MPGIQYQCIHKTAPQYLQDLVSQCNPPCSGKLGPVDTVVQFYVYIDIVHQLRIELSGEYDRVGKSIISAFHTVWLTVLVLTD